MTKSFFNLLVINSLCFLMLNCMNKPAQSTNPTSPKVGATNQVIVDGCTEAVTVTKGQLLIVKLPAISGTGYVWKPNGTLSLLKMDMPDIIPYEDSGADGAVGKTSKQVMTFSAEKEGVETLDLVYKRAFGNEGALEKCSIKVTIQ